MKDHIAKIEGRPKKPNFKASSSNKDSRGKICEDGDQKNKSKKEKNDNSSVNREEKEPIDIHDTVKLTIPDVPDEWTFKGYKSFIVQDIKIQQHNTEYLRAYYIDKNGLRNFLIWLDTPTTIADIRKVRKESGVYKTPMVGRAETEVTGADMFGPKVGLFMKNITKDRY